MSNAQIEVIRAATLSIAGAFPLFSYGFPADAHARALDQWAASCAAGPQVAFVVPVQHGTGVDGSGSQALNTEFVKAAPLAGLAAVPRQVTAQEDQWLRRAAVRSARLVAPGKLVTLQA